MNKKPTFTKCFTCIIQMMLLIFLALTTATSCGKGSGRDTPAVPPVTPPATDTAQFTVVDSKILDKNGNEFVPKGVNVNGSGWPWTRLTIPDANLITDTWKFNTVRLNCWAQNPPYINPNNADIDAIIKTFTDKKIVVMLEDHSFTGKYPTAAELATAASWWTALANKYKTNGYVWFNLMNEPGNGGDAPASWLDVHETLIRAIRNAGANNIIVCDEHSYGQANGFDKPASSAVLTFGEGLTAKYKNLVFSLHMYDLWLYGEGRLQNYTSAVQAKKLALIIGEYGVGDNSSAEVASTIFKVCVPKKIGRIAWHWAGGDVYKLTTTGEGGGFSIDNVSGTKPGNLSYGGNLVWLDNHGSLQVTDPALVPPAVLVSNADFESGTPANDATDINAWINFGTAHLDNDPANVKQGSLSLRINQDATGGCGQSVYLQPGATYKITSWGKNSVTASVASSIGLKYTSIAGGAETQAVSLDFTGNTFQEKTTSFTLPAGIASMFIFIYKSDAAPAFWCDDIRIEKQ